MPRMPATGEMLNVEVLTDKIKALLSGDNAWTTEAGFLGARVREVEGDLVVLTLETPASPPSALAEGASIILHYHDENGLYLLLGKVVNRTGPALFTIQVRGAAEHQRRRDVRKKVRLPVRYKPRPEGEVALELFDWRHGYTRDISRNGLLLEADEGLVPGDHLQIELQLLGSTVAAEGRVTRVKASEAGANLVGVRFTCIAPPDQEAIGWFVVS